MSKKVTKVLAVTMAMAMALSLVACGGAASEAPAESAAPAASEAAPAAPAEGATEGRPAGYPEKDITYINPFQAGSSHEVYARLLFQKAQEMEGWEHGVVFTQAEGASGDVGWTKIAQAEPDGYTVGFCPTAMLINATAAQRDYTTEGFDNIMGMMSDPGVIGVAADSEYNTLNELLEAAKTKPVSIGVTAVTASEGLAITQLQQAAGVELNVIPFDGEAAVLTAVSGHHCDSFCLNVSDGKTFVDEGSIKYLATGDDVRSEFYPDLPTYKEAGYDVKQVNVRSIGCPEGTDPAIIQYLSDCLVAAAELPEVQAKAEEMQLPIMTMDHETCTALFEEVEQGYKDLWATNPWQ